MSKCDMCDRAVQIMSGGRVYCENLPGRRICRMQSDDCEDFKPIAYYDTDSCEFRKPETPSCTILWRSGETTYLKGKNALRIARSWLYSDQDCLMVYTPGWIYLKGGSEKVTS